MINFILLQGQPGAGSSLTMLFPLLIFLVFFVFFIFIPQNRQKKQQKIFMDNLKEGMEVYTTSGIVGRITKIDDKTVRLMVDEKTFLRVLKNTVSGEYKA